MTRALRLTSTDQTHPANFPCSMPPPCTTRTFRAQTSPISCLRSRLTHLWFGPIEAGDTRRFVANGYIHVIAQPPGSAKSEGQYGREDSDHYDRIEWLTQ